MTLKILFLILYKVNTHCVASNPKKPCKPTKINQKQNFTILLQFLFFMHIFALQNH